MPAIYFCAPTEENLGRISQDFQKNVYDVYHLNFISPISRQKLEDIASAALQANYVANIHKVCNRVEIDPTRKSSAGLSFWSPAATAAGGNAAADYKYSSVSAAASAGPSTDPAVSSCHQSFSAQSWCNYSPYTTSTRHHMDSHHHPHAQYLAPADDRGRVAAAAAMVAAETAAGFTHDGYGLRNYGAPEPVPSTPYPPPGEH